MNSNVKENEFLNKEKIILGKYKIINRIQKNENLQIYEGKNIISDESIIIKVEQKEEKKKKGLLETEFHYLNNLKSPGIPTITKIGYFKNNIISIQPKLGISLYNLYKKYYGNFKIKDITMIAIQILERIKFIHSKNIIYCDINPKNFSLGIGKYQNIIYMTIFNSAKIYRDKNTLEHSNYKVSNKIKSKNAIFLSVNTLRGVEPSRRDDLESLSYMLIYFLKGGLPWENIKAKNNGEYIRKIYQIKKFYNLSDLCAGIPQEFKLFLNYVKSLKFIEEPDYNYCFSLFYSIFKKMNIINDGIFSWYQEKNKVSSFKIKQFYNRLWENKYFDNNTSMKSIFNKKNEDINMHFNKSNSCFLNIHNLMNHISYFGNKKYSSIMINKNKEESNNMANLSLNKSISVNDVDAQSSIEEKLSDNNIDKSSSKDKNNKSFSPEKEYSIEGKIEQEIGKNKAYEKKQICINKKKNFNKLKNNIENIQKELLNTKEKISNINKKGERQSFNKTKINQINEINKAYSNNKRNKKLFLKTDILLTNYMKKSIPFINSGNSSSKNNYFPNKIKFFNRNDLKNKEENLTFTNFSQIKSRSRKKIINYNLSNTNNTFNTIANVSNKIKNNLNEENKKRKKKILLNLDNILLNTQQLSNESYKSLFNKNNIGNSLKRNSKLNLENNDKDLDKPELIKVIKKKNNNRIDTDINFRSNIYEHKPLSNKYKKVQIYKKNYGSLVENSMKKESFYSNYKNQRFNKKQSEKNFKNIPLSKRKNPNFSKKDLYIPISRNSGNNKKIASTTLSSSYHKNQINNLENEIELGIKNNDINVYKTIRNNNTIFSNFNKLINKKISNKNYVYSKKPKKMQNSSKNKKNNEFFKKFFKISNSPIIHNSISKLNLIQNVSNIYVTKSYLEEKPLTERKNKVLTARDSKNKKIYIKPKNKITQDWALLNKGNITNLILELNNRNNSLKRIQDKNENSQNYYFSELNIYKEN